MKGLAATTGSRSCLKAEAVKKSLQWSDFKPKVEHGR